MFEAIDTSAFPPEREVSLKALYRYSMFEVMYYRPNLWEHSLRVSWIIETLAPLLEKYLTLDVQKARVMALVHDDAELITGDVQAGRKALMSAAQLADLDKSEEIAANQLAEKYPTSIAGYEYKTLLIEMIDKETIESQVVSYADKLDAYNESMHEMLAGNISLLRSVMFYVRTMALFPYKYPALKELLSDKSSPFTYVDDRLNLDLARMQRYSNLKPYTIESIKGDSDFPFYNEWKRMVIQKGGTEGMRWLTEQREYNAVK